MSATTTQRATWRIVPYEVPARDRWNATELDLCPNCGHQTYAANDTLRLVDAETGEELCPWACAENRPGWFDLERDWAVLRAHSRSGVAWQVEKLLRRQDNIEQAPARAARAEEYRAQMRAESEEAQRRQRELDRLEPGERARRARELSW